MSSLVVVFPNNTETRDVADISFKRLQSVFQQPILNNLKSNTLRKCLRDINSYQNWVIKQTFEKVKNQIEMARSTRVTTNTEENKPLLMLPYKETKQEKQD